MGNNLDSVSMDSLRISQATATSSAFLNGNVNERTDCRTVEFGMKWTVQNFQLWHGFKPTLYSSGVSMAELGLHDYEGRWRIEISPQTTDQIENVGVGLRLTDLHSADFRGLPGNSTPCQGDILASVRVRVTTGKANTFLSHGKVKLLISKKATGTGRWNVTSYEALFGLNGQPGKLLDGCLTVSMDIALTVQEKIPMICPDRREFAQRQLDWANSGRILENNFVLSSADDMEFFVNPKLLAAHSPVFAAMLNHDSKEKQLMRCEMPDVDGETTEILIDYLYECETGKINGDNAERVLLMADKYQLLHLRAVSEGVLARNITMDDAVYCLRFASLHKLDGLKLASLKVIGKNMGQLLSKTVIVNSDPEIMQIIMENCAAKARLTATSLASRAL